MKIVGLEGLTGQQVQLELERGARFVVFLYTISVLIVTFKRGSEVHFVRAGEGTAGHSFGYTLLTLLFGWWGIPWGPIYSIQSIYANLNGGKDVTREVLAAFASTPRG